MERKLLITLLLAFQITALQAQEHDEEKTHNGIYELIGSMIYSYSMGHEKANFGNEFHFTYWWNHTWGAGISYTRLYDDHKTNSIALLGSVNPKKWMTLNIGPNLSFSKNYEEFHHEIGGYLEVEFNIRPVRWFHVGPVIGGVVSENSELYGGVHLGFEL
jgi:hypothetical protein